MIEEKLHFNDNPARQSLAKARTIVENIDNIRAMNDRGMEALIDVGHQLSRGGLVPATHRGHR